MGGAAGHMSHLHEDLDITFGEIKSILENVVRANVSVIEKVDGQNIFFTWNAVTGDVHTARDEKDIEKGGMAPAEYADKWKNHGAKDAFMNGFGAIWRGINSLNRNTLLAIFGESGNNWVNSEIMFMNNPNIINYNGDWIVLHGIKTYIPSEDPEEKGEYQINQEAFQLLVSAVEHAENQMDEQNWKISGPRVRQLVDISEKEHYNKFVKELDAIGMPNNATLGAYVEKMFHQEHYNQLSLPEDKKDLLFLRIMKLCRGVKPRELAETNPELDMNNIHAGDREYKSQLKTLGLSNVQDILRKRNQYLFPVEVAISNLAIEVLRGLKSYFVDIHDETVNKIRKKLEDAETKINNLIATGNMNAEKLSDLLDKQLGKLGSYENIASSLEGVIFEYPLGSHKLYKITGAFAMINQIVGRAPRDENPLTLSEQEERDLNLDPPEEYNPAGRVSIGLVPMSAKPFHAGHLCLIEKASKDNDFVKVFASLTDRVKPKQYPVYGTQMQKIWEEHLMKLMPSNVDVDLLEESVQPVKLVYETLGNADEANSQHTYQVYSDAVDTPVNYPEHYRQKYFPTIYNNDQVRFPAIENPEHFTRGCGMPDISATKVRKALQDKNFQEFAEYMPPGMDVKIIWNILLGIEEESEITETKKKGATFATICRIVEEVMEEQTEPFQMKVKAKHSKAKKDYLSTGGNKETGGGCGFTKPSMKRGKSAPPMEESEELEEMSSMGGGSVEGHSGGAWIGFEEEENEKERKRTKKKTKTKKNGILRRESKEDEFVEEIINYLLKAGRSKK